MNYGRFIDSVKPIYFNMRTIRKIIGLPMICFSHQVSLLPSQAIEAVFFDLDATLVSSTLNFQQIRQELGYEGEVDFLQLIQRLPPTESQRIQEIIHRHECEDAEAATAMPGAASLLHFCQLQGWPTVVVTRNSRSVAALKLQRSDLQVDKLIARDDAFPAKPDPTVFLSLFNQYGLTANRVIYVGDYIYDIQTARNAGMISALTYEDNLPEFANQSDICIKGLTALERWLTQHQKNAAYLAT